MQGLNCKISLDEYCWGAHDYDWSLLENKYNDLPDYIESEDEEQPK